MFCYKTGRENFLSVKKLIKTVVEVHTTFLELIMPHILEAEYMSHNGVFQIEHKEDNWICAFS